MIRWEWVESIQVADGVTVRSATAEVRIPKGAFGTDPASLAERLEQARSIPTRGEAIASLNDR